MISLDIKGFGHHKHFSRAVTDTKLTAFTPVLDYNHSAFANLDGAQIKGISPKSHFGFL